MTFPADTTSSEPLAFMLLWNPDVWHWDEDAIDTIESDLRDGRTTPLTWSVNSFPRLIRPGSRIFLRKSGTQGRRIIAEGIATSYSCLDRSFRPEDRKSAHYVDMDLVAFAREPLASTAMGGHVPAMTSQWPRAIRESAELETIDAAWRAHLEAQGAEHAAHSLDPAVRRYLSKSRLFQSKFRELILQAHGVACSVCGLAVAEVIEAAHVLAHSRGGLPTVENGRPLCRNHHRAFDTGLMRWCSAEKRFTWAEGVASF